MFRLMILASLNCAAAAIFEFEVQAAQPGTVFSWGEQVIPYLAPGTKFTKIAAGDEHSLALKSDGTVVAWGDNYSGESTVPTGLNGVAAIAAELDQSLAFKSNGTVVTWGAYEFGQADLKGVVAIAAGWIHRLALKSDGTVVAWGNNNYGQTNVPAGLNGVLAIAAGEFHSMALKSNGTVVVWGDNRYGQTNIPAGLNGVIAIAAGGYHSLALKSDGTVVAWGNNSYGQTNVPTGLNKVVAIAAGWGHSLTLKSDGTVVAWGDNDSGQSTVPTGLNDVTAIAAGGWHSLALKSDGAVVTWGDNCESYSTSPPGLTGVSAIAAGQWHNLALKPDGTVFAWGYVNAYSGVPAGLNAVVAVAAGWFHSLALKSDGTIVAWGDNSSGQTNVPAGLNGVVAIAAGGRHNLALKNDGTVVAWAFNSDGQTTVPASLNGVVAVAAGSMHSLALESNGTVVAWGANDSGQTNVPVGLNGVVAIAAGEDHSLALKTDGTIVAWGSQTSVPVGLSGVVAIRAGNRFSLALKSDGTIVTWGDNSYGQCTIPPGLGRVVAIAAGGWHSMALVAEPNQGPEVQSQPLSQTAQAGSSITLTITATGTTPLNFQWQFNGQNIPNATNATLSLNSVTAANDGGYSVVVWNAYGSVTSATASLAVLTDGANGNTPVPITATPSWSKPSTVKNLVFITHGWQPVEANPFGPPAQPWMAAMTNAIAQQLGGDSTWQFETYDWTWASWTLEPQQALSQAEYIGTLLGKAIAGMGYQQVHLIAHSAGSGMIQAIADQLRAAPNPPQIQLTFLDPYIGIFHQEQNNYGKNADWSDCYFVEDGTGGFTGSYLNLAFNVDVSWVDPAHTAWPYVGLGGGKVALSSHGYPIDFYLGSMTGGNSPCSSAYGFALSEEMEGVFWFNNQANYPVGTGPFLPCSPADAVKNPIPGIAGLESGAAGAWAVITDIPHALSQAGATLIGNAGAELQSIWSALPLVKSGGIQPADNTANTPAWLAMGLTVTNAVNFVQFDAGFTDTNTAQGLLTVYWNTNQVGMVDERVAQTNLQTYRFLLPGTVSSGLYTLSFRLDSFANTSTVAVTNVTTGFVGMTQPTMLRLSITNRAPLVQLTAATNFSYLIQSSTNLVDWTPAAMLLNTNGSVQFTDSAVTNSKARFYRAVVQ